MLSPFCFKGLWSHWGPDTSLLWGAHPGNCRAFSKVFGLYPLDASNTSSFVTIKHPQMTDAPWGTKSLQQFPSQNSVVKEIDFHKGRFHLKGVPFVSQPGRELLPSQLSSLLRAPQSEQQT